jgi:putative methionine-R-sulfoxide reductase with GAF domain
MSPAWSSQSGADAGGRPRSERPYGALLSHRDYPRDRAGRMQTFVDRVWSALRTTDVSWIGFYLWEGGDELRLGPRRDKPACSPIGLHGACGRAFRERRPLIVTNVAHLGAAYIACDPQDRSEVVLPLFEADGTCWGVLDLDSHEPSAFAEPDVRGLQALLSAAGLTDAARLLASPFVV